MAVAMLCPCWALQTVCSGSEGGFSRHHGDLCPQAAKMIREHLVPRLWEGQRPWLVPQLQGPHVAAGYRTGPSCVRSRKERRWGGGAGTCWCGQNVPQVHPVWVFGGALRAAEGWMRSRWGPAVGSVTCKKRQRSLRNSKRARPWARKRPPQGPQHLHS